MPKEWKAQFGSAQAGQYLREIAQAAGSSPDDLNVAFERMATVANGGVLPVTWDVDVALSLAGGGLGLEATRNLAKWISGKLTAGGTKANGAIAEGWRLVYLSNSTAPMIRDRLSSAISEIRIGLPREGNVAFAEVDVAALSPETMVMKAYSRFNDRDEEFLPKPSGDLNSWVLKPQVSTSKYVGTPEGYLRDMDTEFKILETLAQRLGPSSQVSGRINLISEKVVCPSCSGIVSQFRERYPNIQLNVFTVEK